MGLLIPTAGQCLAIVAPVASVCSIIWFARYGDRVIESVFPHWEWERKLGWLNFKANRRAAFMLRGVRHLVHAFLLLALVGLLNFSYCLGQPQDLDTVPGFITFTFQGIDLIACLAPWIYYLFFVLAPRVTAEYEEEELMRYRAENPEDDSESASGPPPKHITVWGATRSYRRL
jgi:hypothetical protein